MPGTSQLKPLSIPDLRASIQGQVITPDDAIYDEARTIFPGGIDRRPAVIVRVAGAEDVSHVIRLAMETGLPLAVRSGGHSNFGVNEGGIVLDLSAMKAIDIDVAGKTAWAETGLTATEYTAATGAHGLATGFGDAGTVGIGGITLGGGVGYLGRKHGLTIDSLLAAEVVTADGVIQRIDADSNPDLFWAIRGGGGNFCVATRFQYRLHDVSSVVGGMMFLPATPEVIVGFLDAAAAAPEELSTIANVMPAPPMPFLPPEHHGQIVVMAMMAYVGDIEAGERAFAPFRDLASPIVDMVHPIPFIEMYPPEMGEYHPIASGQTFFTDEIDLEKAETIMESLKASTAMMRATQLRVLGGAIARVDGDATAFAHRQRQIMVNVAAVYESVDQAEIHEPWVDGLSAALTSGPGAYVGFLGDDGVDRIREAYPGQTFERLAAIKKQYDPTNLFRLNQNIAPS